MPPEFLITRKIEIDAGHRIPDHKSKCKNFHGHRYVIEATCGGGLHESGEEHGMVMDFGFLKQEMVKEIDEPCDHGMMLYFKDPIVVELFKDTRHELLLKNFLDHESLYWLDTTILGKTYFMNTVPTAENLAAHWFYRLKDAVERRTSGWGSLQMIRVYETPNCWAEVTEDSLNVSISE